MAQSELQKALKSQGIAIVDEADENGEGPGSFMLSDPAFAPQMRSGLEFYQHGAQASE